jgi:hypothetical protein
MAGAQYQRWSARAAVGLVALVGLGALATGCSSGSTTPVSAGELRSYIADVDRIRLPVNQLLEGADPIFDALSSKKISAQTAADRMGALEGRFARYTVAINALDPSNPRLKSLNALYAHTFLYEDSYLSALTADLPDGDFDNLPNTQNKQRFAIIEWRTQLEVLAQSLHVHLPADLQQAGRGEIAPAPDGS